MSWPRIFLAVDNCFASKKWTRPSDWAKVIRDMGIKYVEASADTELDPLFMGKNYLKRWVEEVKKAEDTIGVKVVNLYSGHGTYCTLGLTHTDADVRKRMKEKWFKPMIKTAAELNAGIGFFAHALADYILQDAGLYHSYVEMLYNNLAELNEFAGKVGCGKMGLEQMYSPHQVPWRIKETKMLLKEVTSRSGRDFYFTEDVGHHHIMFVKPSAEEIAVAFKTFYESKEIHGLWLGTDRAYELFRESEAQYGKITQRSLDSVLQEIEKNPHMFAAPEDGDCYEWIKCLGCYSPIIHLQQTDGLTSAHMHFTPENNKWGKIEPIKILKALKESYDAPEEKGMPRRCDNIYFTLEAFTPTASINHDTLKDCRASVDYWREYIPQDGIKLNILTGE